MKDDCIVTHLFIQRGKFPFQISLTASESIDSNGSKLARAKKSVTPFLSNASVRHINRLYGRVSVHPFVNKNIT
jgi:hypothetical protein